MWNKRRLIELAGMIFLVGIIVWQQGVFAPWLLIVLSFWSCVLLALVLLPFAWGMNSARPFRLPWLILIVTLPFLIASGYWLLYDENILGNWQGGPFDWRAAAGTAGTIVLLPVLSFLAGRIVRKFSGK